MMTNKELFNTVISRLETESFLSGFKFRKRDSTFIWQNHGLRRFIELDHWNKNGLFIIYPIYIWFVSIFCLNGLNHIALNLCKTKGIIRLWALVVRCLKDKIILQ